ncbi:hypothetical protein FDP41_007725 [Naegleria fowleri]|uniref:F-box domain-containing protein n=1 Tax=Naegleria fowleri TaxID=5763 RepID=A0A6A5CE14_NAEFO|nr:uncharacterized protein FDP41_007725 [Naegleria fowleri]KAF0983810.1 hypothetical protein FDP41_007725 [Naegleria fowleri]
MKRTLGQEDKGSPKHCKFVHHSKDDDAADAACVQSSCPSSLNSLPDSAFKIILQYLATFVKLKEESDESDDDSKSDQSEDDVVASSNAEIFLGWNEDLHSLSLVCSSIFLKCFPFQLDYSIQKVFKHVTSLRDKIEIFRQAESCAHYYKYTQHLAQKRLNERKAYWKEWFSSSKDYPQEYQSELQKKLLDRVKYNFREIISPIYDDHTFEAYFSVDGNDIIHFYAEGTCMDNGREEGSNFSISVKFGGCIKEDVLSSIENHLQLPLDRSCYDDDGFSDEEIEEEGETNITQEFQHLMGNTEDVTELKISSKTLQKLRNCLEIGEEISNNSLVQAILHLLPLKRNDYSLFVYYESMSFIDSESSASESDSTSSECNAKKKWTKSQHKTKKDYIKSTTNLLPLLNSMGTDMIIHIMKFLKKKHMKNFALTCRDFHRYYMMSGWSFATRFISTVSTIFSFKALSLMESQTKYDIIQKIITQLRDNATYRVYASSPSNSNPCVRYIKLRYGAIDYKSFVSARFSLDGTVYEHFALDDEGSSPYFKITKFEKKETSTQDEVTVNCLKCSNGKANITKSFVKELEILFANSKMPQRESCIFNRSKKEDEESKKKRNLVEALIRCLPWDSSWNWVFFSGQVNVVDRIKYA